MEDALFMKTKQTGLSVVTIIKIMLKKTDTIFHLVWEKYYISENGLCLAGSVFNFLIMLSYPPSLCPQLQPL